LRNLEENQINYEPLMHVGERAADMVDYVNEILRSEKNPGCREVIVSGGIRNFLDGYWLIKKLATPAIFGQASGFLLHARESYEDLHRYVEGQVNGLKLAQAYLTLKP
jgi:isopentenyl-diphosphate delta-isomerase